MKVHQRDIVEVNYELPDGSLKVHPAIVLSNDDVLVAEDVFYAAMIFTKPFNDEFIFELDDEMLTKPLRQKSFVKCQLLGSYSASEVLSKISAMKAAPFAELKKHLFDTVF